jgi:hypothetical protein
VGNNLFGKDIAGKINRALGSRLMRATLVKRSPGTRTSDDLTAGTNPTQQRRSARGIVSDYSEGQVDGTLVQSGDRRVLLLGDSIAGRAVPEPNDEVEIGGTSYVVVRVKADPDIASYECQARRA